MAVAARACAPAHVGHRRASRVRMNLRCSRARHPLHRWLGRGKLPHNQFGWFSSGTCGGGNGGNAPFIRFRYG